MTNKEKIDKIKSALVNMQALRDLYAQAKTTRAQIRKALDQQDRAETAHIEEMQAQERNLFARLKTLEAAEEALSDFEF